MKKIEFIKSITKTEDAPKDNLPEIILCGRSNVGKSTFINNVFNKKGIAKTSSSPGKTRTLNYYLVENDFYIVDLPGYGYAKVSKKERVKWQQMIDEYLRNSNKIVSAIHFIDSRHKPTELDHILYDFISELKIHYFVILNKVDKLKQSELAASKKTIMRAFPNLEPEKILPHSSLKRIDKKIFFNVFNYSIS